MLYQRNYNFVFSNEIFIRNLFKKQAIICLNFSRKKFENFQKAKISFNFSGETTFLRIFNESKIWKFFKKAKFVWIFRKICEFFERKTIKISINLKKRFITDFPKNQNFPEFAKSKNFQFFAKKPIPKLSNSKISLN